MSSQIIVYLFLILSEAAFGRNLRIIGGTDADIRDFPYVASLRTAENNVHFCGGAIITKQHILTAAHCFQEVPEDVAELRVYTGSSYLTSNLGSWHLIDTIFIHPLFNGMRTESETLLYDVAIVKV